MKKIFMVFILLIVTGCGNKLICTLETTEEDYSTKEKLIFEEKEKKFEASVEYIMTFKDEETANSYLNIIEIIDESYEINLTDNRINIKTFKSFEQYGNDRNELKKELEQNGYLCN